MYSIMSSMNSDNFTSSFSIWISFISSCLIGVARTFYTVLHKSGKSGHLCLVPDVRVDASRWLCHIQPLLHHVPSISTLLSVFTINGCWQALFLHPLRWLYDIYSLFVNLMYCIGWFVDIEPSLHPWEKSNLIMLYDPFNVLLDLIC